MDIHNRIKEIRESNNLTKLAMAARLKMDDSQYSKVEAGTKGLTIDKVTVLCSEFGVNANWLLTGSGERLVSDYTIIKRHSKLRTDRKKEAQEIPLYDVQATAGIVQLLNDSTHSKFIPIDYITIPNLPKCDGALPITGDSMYPLLKSGDIALYKEVQDRANIIWGEMYLVAIEHKGDSFFFAKYIQKSDKEGWVKLVSANQHHQPKEFPMDSIKGLALIKASIRINTGF